MKKAYANKRLKDGKILCSKCNRYQPLAEFHNRAEGFLGKNSQCKECVNIYSRQWQEKHPLSPKQKQRARDYRKNNISQMRRYERDRLLRKYGLTSEQYTKMLVAQEGMCAICRQSRADSKREALHIDHDHETLIVRGLLCSGCNTALGKFYNIELLQNAITYLTMGKVH